MSMALTATATSRPDRRPRPRALAFALGSLCAALLLGCQPADQNLPAAVSAASGVQASKLKQRLEHIEREARARPREFQAELQKLQADMAPGSDERLRLLGLRGELAGISLERGLIEQIATELEQWPNPKTAAAAKVVAATAWARLHRERGDLREAVKVLRQASPAAVASLPPALELRYQQTRSFVEGDAGNLDASIVAVDRALKLAEASGEGWRKALVLADLANVYMRSQQPERGKQTIEEAVRIADSDSDLMTQNQVQTARAIVFTNLNDLAGARQSFEKALELSTQAGAPSVMALNLGNLADFHLRQGQYPRALELATQALKMAREARNHSAESVSLHNSGIAKIALKRIEEGKAEVRQSITMDEQQGAITIAADGWLELGQYLEKAGDLAGAIDAYHRYRELSDRVLRDDARKTVLEQQERYDAEQRAREMELINRDNSLKSEQIRARELQLKLWAALGGCIVLSAVLLGLAYQRIRRTNQALATSNEKLKVQSERDPLTGLANRRHFQAAIKRLAAKGGLTGTVFLIDIDHFKRINDQHGHAAGDSVLIEVARRLRAALREDDLVVRWGGEEFLIVVETRDAATAQHLAQRLLDLIAQPAIMHGSLRVPVTASIGYGSFPLLPNELAVDWERAIDLVDTVMYMAKAHGRNRAYGIERIDVADEAGLQAVSTRMEAAWHEGQVGLSGLQGPAAESRQ
ncbi:diguanylate cyclase [Pelomonas sp. SE-A7]|uniref:diguanylate cyclase domain-containing protein n=1 Tax=Pelomonas sp. SE-A7 TaxID=3054953 RepID=UPI00259CBF4F|nr:diguanylate cyclase [Pelomonas sp. SE-A7]MDM4767148.1 diguanylate cyclase [Pelomonas sp. SE-A7]